jgi:signal transduction histidine kinase
MVTELPLYNKILIILIDFIALWLSIVVYSNTHRKKIRRIFLAMIASMFLWVNFAYLARLIGRQLPVLGLISLKIAWSASPLLFILIYFLAVFYLNKERKYFILNRIIFLSGLVALLTALFTDLIVKDIKFIGSDLSIIYGQGMVPFLGLALFFMCAPLYILIKEYIKCSLQERIRIEYLLVGIFIFYLANVIFGIIFPIFLEIVHYYWIGDYSTIILLGFVAYAIARRELFGIKIAFTATLVSLITILLTLDIFVFTSQLLLRLYKALVLVLFIYFGYLLIKSVLKEIEYREEVKKAYDLEKRAHQELERLDEAKTQFMMATQHHLRTPLTAMIGYLDLIFGGTYGKVPSKIKQALLKFQISTQRLNKVINELLDISQFQLGKKVVLLQPGVDVNGILKEIVDDLKLEAKTKGIYLKFQSPARLPAIKADKEKLKVALANIIDNAVKYTLKGGVTVATKTTDSKILISIQDTGIGISNDEQRNLFNRTFERGERAKGVNTTGKGIGLYITYHIIQAHHGRIWAESEGKGKGSAFYIELPIN